MQQLIRSLIRSLLIFSALFFSLSLSASPVLKLEMSGSFDENYAKVSHALDENRFYVIFEPNIGRSLSNFKERWGEDYNRNRFEEVRSLVFCNPWYVNQVLNKDPEMAALCPLSVTLLQKGGTTELLFLRPGQLKPDSPAQAILLELEQDITQTLKQALSAE